METKKILFIVVGVLVILSIFTIINNPRRSINKKELTDTQVLSLMELDAINIHTDIEYSDRDKMINIIARTVNGDCVIYQDIFGRYYCRW